MEECEKMLLTSIRCRRAGITSGGKTAFPDGFLKITEEQYLIYQNQFPDVSESF